MEKYFLSEWIDQYIKLYDLKTNERQLATCMLIGQGLISKDGSNGYISASKGWEIEIDCPIDYLMDGVTVEFISSEIWFKESNKTIPVDYPVLLYPPITKESIDEAISLCVKTFGIETWISIINGYTIIKKYFPEPIKLTPTSVYCIHNRENNTYKIGVSKSVEKRHLVLRMSGGLNDTDLLIHAVLPSYSDALKVEARLHKKYHTKRTSGEWFALDKKELDEVIKTIKSLN
jgi:predicted GIY-YIG superfamily endonuclease